MSTIVAISTAPGIGGIGIIRMSGKECFEILNKIFIPIDKNKIEEVKGFRMKYGHIVDENRKIVDEVIVSFFKEPHSYTTENMCEINSHGGSVIMKKILELCIVSGAVLAEPGEFTKRAFLNGRIDLSQAEAVIDVINSKTEKEAENSVNQLEGKLSNTIREVREKIIDIMSDIEASIDYPEYDIEEVTNEKVRNVLKFAKERLQILERNFDNGKILREGIKTVIIGKPNVGKSSLLNAILGEERAIVTSIEGTTRDTIEEFVSVEGVPIKIVDTAGIREAKDEVEKIGIEKSKEVTQKGDIIIAIFDMSTPFSKEDLEIIEMIKNKNAIVVLNKIDLPRIEENLNKIKELNKPIVEVSALKKEGIEKIFKEISKMFNLTEITSSEEIIVTNTRHKSIIIEAIKNIEQAEEAIGNNMPIDIISSNLKEILEAMGKITGETVTEDVIKEIFKKFCLGK